MLKNENNLETCSLYYATKCIEGKWKPFIIWYLFSSPNMTRRYGELKRSIPWNISDKMFTQQLNELERDNIIKRYEYDEKPLRVEYSLTEEGRLLSPALLYMRDWGAFANDEFDTYDLLDRTLAERNGNDLLYRYESKQNGMCVEIKFTFEKLI